MNEVREKDGAWMIGRCLARVHVPFSVTHTELGVFTYEVRSDKQQSRSSLLLDWSIGMIHHCSKSRWALILVLNDWTLDPCS